MPTWKAATFCFTFAYRSSTTRPFVRSSSNLRVIEQIRSQNTLVLCQPVSGAPPYTAESIFPSPHPSAMISNLCSKEYWCRKSLFWTFQRHPCNILWRCATFVLSSSLGRNYHIVPYSLQWSHRVTKTHKNISDSTLRISSSPFPVQECNGRNRLSILNTPIAFLTLHILLILLICFKYHVCSYCRKEEGRSKCSPLKGRRKSWCFNETGCECLPENQRFHEEVDLVTWTWSLGVISLSKTETSTERLPRLLVLPIGIWSANVISVFTSRLKRIISVILYPLEW